MSIVFLLLVFALLLSGFFLVAYLWQVKNGQFDDLKTPKYRILLDDEPKREGTK